MRHEAKNTETTDYTEAWSEGYSDYRLQWGMKRRIQRLPTTPRHEAKDTETTDYTKAWSEGYRAESWCPWASHNVSDIDTLPSSDLTVESACPKTLLCNVSCIHLHSLTSTTRCLKKLYHPSMFDNKFGNVDGFFFHQLLLHYLVKVENPKTLTLTAPQQTVDMFLSTLWGLESCCITVIFFVNHVIFAPSSFYLRYIPYVVHIFK